MNKYTNKRICKIILPVVAAYSTSCLGTDKNFRMKEYNVAPPQQYNLITIPPELVEGQTKLALYQTINNSSDLLLKFFKTEEKLKFSLSYLLAQMEHETNLTALEENLNYRPARLMQIFGNRLEQIVKAINDEEFTERYKKGISLRDFIDKNVQPEVLEIFFPKQSKISVQQIMEFLYDKKNIDLKSTEKVFPFRKIEFANFAYNFINGNEKVNDGYEYRGGGYLQLTGRYNYRKASEWLDQKLKINLDLENIPESVHKDVTLAFLSGIGYFGFKGLFEKIPEKIDIETIRTISKTVMGRQLGEGEITNLKKSTEKFATYFGLKI